MKKTNVKRKLRSSLGTCFKKFTALILAMLLLFSSSVVSYAGVSDDNNMPKNITSFFKNILSGLELYSDDSNDDQIIEILKFDMDIIDGYTRTEDGGYVWEANTSAPGHTFIFNILFQTSGNAFIEEGAVKIKIPGSVLKDKDGNPADIFEMSVPHIDQITDEVLDLHDWAYYLDENGDIIITNIKSIPAGYAYRFDVGYTTNEESFNYEDMEFFDNIHAELDFNVSGSETKKRTDDMKVAIDTSVSIVQTNKNKPMQIYKEWDDIWGEKPDDADDYYYLIWEVDSLIDEKATQYYNFSLKDYDFKVTSPSDLDSSKLKVLGYNYYGNGNSYSLEPDTVENQTKFGSRYDFVLTAIPKEWYDNLGKYEQIILENNVEATVDPIDGVDDDTKAVSQQTYALEKPKFPTLIPNYWIEKKGNRRTYQLDLFTDPDDNTKLTPFYYDITATGFSYKQTYSETVLDEDKPDDYVPEEDYRNYGKKKLHYELTDEQVTLEGYVGDELKTPGYTLKKGDYYFTSIPFTYDIDMVSKDIPFDEENQRFNLTKATVEDNISFDVYGEFEEDGEYKYKKIATVKAYNTDAGAVTYEPGMEEYAKITGIFNNGFGINIAEGKLCTGFKIVSSDDYYYSVRFTAQPGILLKKDNVELQKWINDRYGEEDAEDNEDKVTELRVTNTANLRVADEDEEELFNGSDSGTDYQNESTKESSITKSITATNNNPLYKRYEISWRIDISEYVLVSNNRASAVPVTQYGGEFFDLLPKGSSVDLSTVQVYREGNDPVEFTAKTLPGADNRVLLRVTVDADQPGEKYSLCFTSYHSWDDIAAFGSDILNPAAYVTGNDEMADTEYDGIYKRGKYFEDSMDLMIDSINSVDSYDKNKTIFNYEPFDIKAIVMSNVGVSKAVKNAHEGGYSTATTIDEEKGEYSYRLRIENGTTTKSIDNVFVDFLEAFEGDGEDGVRSLWKGTLKSIDVSNLEAKGIVPRVYYSTDTFGINESTVWYVDDETGRITYLVDGKGSGTYTEGSKAGESWLGIRDFLPSGTFDDAGENKHWTLIDPALCENGIYNLRDADDNCVIDGLDLRTITAIIIDFTFADPEKFNESQIEKDGTSEDDLADLNKDAKITEDNKYIMDLGEAAYVIVNMDNSGQNPPLTRDQFSGTDKEYEDYVNHYNTYNDIFFAANIFNRNQTSKNANDNWLEQNYTTVSYRIRSDFYAKKVNADNTDKTIGGITFNLSGTSYYGTTVNQNITTTSNGILEFDDLEIGVYTLIEVDCGKDWQIDRTEYTVTVNSDKTVTVDPDLSENKNHSTGDNPFVLTNKPRAHADIVFDKNLFDNGEMVDFGIEGATFKLSGVSDYGNEIVKIAVSGYKGKVLFEDVEKGTYELVEVEAPEGYVLSNKVYTVTVDEHSNWSITASGESLLQGDNLTGYTVGNEKYKEFYIQKISSQAVGEPRKVQLLDGAVFNLYGITEGGKVVDINATTEISAKYFDGVAYFGNLEPGTYYLREIVAPTYVYTDKDGNEVEQKFYLDESIYTVVVDDKGVTITDPNGNVLKHAQDDEGKIINDLYTFTNVPVGGRVIVRKVWVDDLTSEERAEKVDSPDIVISRDEPEPFSNEYAIFDYSYSGSRLGNLASSINSNVKLTDFKRYTGRVTFSQTETVAANGTAYPKLLINGEDVGAVIVSTADSPEPIYGWLDADGTYYWYTKAIGAKLLTARYLFTNVTTLEKADFSGVDFSDTENFEYMFNSCSNLVDVKNLTRPADAVEASASHMFNNCTNLAKDKKLDLSGFNTKGITDMSYMFAQAMKNGSGTVIDWGTAFNTEDVKTFSYMFDSCAALKELNAVRINAENVEVVKSGNTTYYGFEYMFKGCSLLVDIPKLIRSENAAEGLSTSYMFSECRHLGENGSLDFTEFNTTGITNMSRMFNAAIQNGSGTVLAWGDALNTEDVTTFSHMFDANTALIKLDAEVINADSVTAGDGFEWMFGNSQKLVSVPPITRSSTVSSAVSMSSMFNSCYLLVDLDLSGFYTHGINNMSSLFNHCRALTTIATSHFDTSSVTNMASMFAQCQSLISVDVTSFDTSKVTSMANMFDNCSKLTELDVSSFTMESLTSADTMFCNCQALVTIYANESFDLSELTAKNGNMFQNDNYLEGGSGTKYKEVQEDKENNTNRAYGIYAHIDGIDGKQGYFTFRAKPNNNSQQEGTEKTADTNTLKADSSKFGAKIRSIFGGNSSASVTAYADTEAANDAADAVDTSDGPDYRNSANHNNQNECLDNCKDNHFFIAKTKSDLDFLSENYPEIYELVKDLKDNEWIYVFDDVVGEDFYVWEEFVPDGYESDYDNYIDEDGNHRYTRIVDGVATITNKKQGQSAGVLTINKAVFDLNTQKDVTYDVNAKYTFEITLSNISVVSPQVLNAVYYNTDDEENTKEDKSILFVDGKATVEIQSGYTLKFSDLPVGTTYEVKECDDKDVTETKINGSVVDGNTITGQIQDESDISVRYENIIDFDDRETGEFMLKKLVENENGAVDPEVQYSFTVEFTNLKKNTEYSVYNGEEVIKTFTSGDDKTATVVVYLKADDVLTFKDIPEDATYRITEAAGGAYISSYVVTTGDANANTSAGNELSTQWQVMKPSEDAVTTTFTNKIVKVQSVSLSKTVSDKGSGMIDKETKYKFVAKFSNLGAGYQLVAAGIGTFTADEYGNLQLEFYLKSGETVDFNNIPVGATYNFYEDIDDELIPYYEVTYTDETTGETQKESQTPSASTADDIAREVKAAQATLDAAQTAYDVAVSLLSYDKKQLDSAIAEALEKLTEDQKKDYVETIAAFTADIYIDNKEVYEAARDVILKLIPDSESYEESIKAAQTDVTNAVKEYQSASEALAAAQEALKKARGSSYVEGSVELNKDTAIDFSNIKPYDLTITKEVTGQYGDLNKEFYFKVKFEYKGIPLEGSYLAALLKGARITDSSYQTDEAPYEDFDENPNKAYYVFGDDGYVYFVLKHGSSITFENLPYDTTYTIEEAAVESYDVTVKTVSDNKETVTEGETVSGIIHDDVTANYVNKCNPQIADLPDTGGYGVTAFYVFGSVLLALGLLLFLYSKRTKRRKI